MAASATSSSLVLLSFVVVHLLLFIPRICAQGTNATCLDAFAWMTNSRGQSPCLVSAYLLEPCRGPAGAFVYSLPPDYHYIAPTSITADPCACNTVLYSTMAACAICQGRNQLSWSTWQTNCSSPDIGSYPVDIFSGTSIPAWAYLNITAEDGFDVVAAENLAGAPESSAAVSSTDLFPASTTTSLASTFITTSTFTTTSNDSSIPTASASPFPTNSSSVTGPIILKSSRVSAIVGGMVGGVAGLMLLTAAASMFVRRRRASRIPASAQFTAAAAKRFSNKQGSMKSPSFAPMVPPRIYNPNDPSTFPPTPSLSSVARSVHQQPVSSPLPWGYNTNSMYVVGPGMYSGAPEI